MFVCLSVISFALCVANRYKLSKKYVKLQQKLDADPENILLRTQVAHAKVGHHNWHQI